jgi:hypothetical protein
VTLEKQKIDEFEDGENCIFCVPEFREKRGFLKEIDFI